MVETAKLVRRHSGWVRLAHWLNVVAVVVLLGTGLNIFNAHPALYWGPKGSNVDTAGRWLMIGAMGEQGKTIIGGAVLDTTGVLGRSAAPNGAMQNIAFPHWATLPTLRNLGLARNWHFAAGWLLIVNGLIYLLWGVLSGHLVRRVLPSLKELRPGNVWHDIREHVRLKFPKGADGLEYQILQKLAYSSVVVVLLPLMVFSGLGMSPGMDASWPWIVDAFGGRQTARSVHFIVTSALVGFVFVHLLMLLLAGPWRLLRGMLTGWQNVGTGQ